MPVCTFSLQHAGTPETLFPIARAAIVEEGGQMLGTPARGAVTMPTSAGAVEFGYTAVGNRLAIEVTDKPFLVSCARIQSELAAILTEVPAPPPIDTTGEAVPLRMAPSYQSPIPASGPGREPPTTYVFTDAETPVIYGRRSPNWLLLGLGAATLAGGGYLLWRARKPKHRRRVVRA